MWVFSAGDQTQQTHKEYIPVNCNLVDELMQATIMNNHFDKLIKIIIKGLRAQTTCTIDTLSIWKGIIQHKTNQETHQMTMQLESI